MKLKSIVAMSAAAMMLTACVGSSPVKPFGPGNRVAKEFPTLKGMPVSQNHTPYSAALMCLSEEAAQNTQYLNQYRHTIAVGEIKDQTGKYDYETGGYKVTQGAGPMVTSALMKTNAYRVVNRYDLKITDYERALASNQLVKEYDFKDNQRVRALTAGEVTGSDYVIVGAITEMNYDIDSAGFEADVAGVGAKSRRYVSNVALDLFLVDTKSTVVVESVSVQKQLVGYETRAGVFRFFNNNLFDVNGGVKKQEPMQLAVRSAIESAVYDFTKKLYGEPSEECSKLKTLADQVSTEKS